MHNYTPSERIPVFVKVIPVNLTHELGFYPNHNMCKRIDAIIGITAHNKK